MAAADVVIRFLGDASNAVAATKQIDDETAKLEKNLRRTGIALTAAVTLPLVAAGTLAFKELEEAGKVAAQTNAVIKSTGGVANVSARQVDELATSISRKSGIDDEAIASGQNLLLTFTNVRNEAGKGNDVFTQATKLSADLSVAWGVDMTDAATKVGKALNDPVAGISALSKLGVTFNAEQKKTIEALVATGDVMGAQKVILAELTTQVGGSANAYGETLAGKVSRARETFLNMGASMISVAAPALELVAAGATGLAEILGNLPGPVRTAVVGFVAFAAALGPILTIAGNMTTIASGLSTAFHTVGTVVQLTVAKVAVLGPTMLATLAPLTAVAVAIAALAAVAYVVSQTFGKDLVGAAKAAAAAGDELGASLVNQASGIKDLTAKHDQLSASLRDLKNVQVDTFNEYVKNVNAQDQVKQAIKGVEAAQEAAFIADLKRGEGLVQVATKSRDFATANDEVRASIESVANAILAAQGGILGYEAAQLQVEAAQKRVNEATAQYGPESLEARQATNALEQANLAAARAAFTVQTTEADLAQIRRDTGVPGLVAYRDSLIRTTAAHGDATGATAKQIYMIDLMIAAANKVPPDKTVRVFAEVDRAIADLERVNAKANDASKPRYLSISVEEKWSHQSGGWTPYASGGLVPGPRSRPHPAILHGGELVVPAAQAAAMQRGGMTSSGSGSGGGTTFNIEVRVEAGVAPAEVGAQLIDRIRAYERVAGAAWRN